MVLGPGDGLKLRCAHRQAPALALDPATHAQRVAVMPYSARRPPPAECHFYFAHRVSFLSCADIAPCIHQALQIRARTAMRQLSIYRGIGCEGVKVGFVMLLYRLKCTFDEPPAVEIRDRPRTLGR
jgi:hypothetical protein